MIQYPIHGIPTHPVLMKKPPPVARRRFLDAVPAYGWAKMLSRVGRGVLAWENRSPTYAGWEIPPYWQLFIAVEQLPADIVSEEQTANA